MNCRWKVDISDEYKQELSGKIGVPEDDIVDCFSDPDTVDPLVFKELHLIFVLKKIPQMPRPYFVLGYGQYIGNILQVSMVWKLYAWRNIATEKYKPTVILRNFAQEFGLPVHIGDKRKQFFIQETITLQKPFPEDIISIKNPDNHEYVQQIFTRHKRYTEKLVIDCALGICIDMDKYRLQMTT